jgi:hypothetical protein
MSSMVRRALLSTIREQLVTTLGRVLKPPRDENTAIHAIRMVACSGTKYRGSILDGDVLTLDIVAFASSFPEGVESYPRLGRFKGTERQVAYSCDAPRLRPLGDERRGEESASQCADECTSVHRVPPSWPRCLGGTGRAASSDLTTAESRAGVTHAPARLFCRPWSRPAGPTSRAASSQPTPSRVVAWR